MKEPCDGLCRWRCLVVKHPRFLVRLGGPFSRPGLNVAQADVVFSIDRASAARPGATRIYCAEDGADDALQQTLGKDACSGRGPRPSESRGWVQMRSDCEWTVSGPKI